jgi:membrane protease YdiL (CAAX protease family)
VPWVAVASIATEQLARQIGADPQAKHALFTLWEGDNTGVTLFKVMAIFSAVVAAPISEELVFRGLLQRIFQDLTRRPAAAIVLTSLAFALVHQPWQLWPAVFVLSLFLGLAYFRTGNLLVPILAHALFNAVQLTLFSLLPG